MIPREEEKEKRNRRSAWFRASTVTKYLRIRSQVGWFRGHWTKKAGGSVRCIGAECVFCSSGDRARVFLYVFVEDAEGEVLVWEIPWRLRDVAYELEQQTWKGVGCVVSVCREGVMSNSRICASIVGEERVEELDIWAFVDSLGWKLGITRDQALPESLPLQNTHHDPRDNVASYT